MSCRTTALLCATLALVAVASGPNSRASAAPLTLASGSITFDTDTLSLSGDVSATGVLIGNTATFTFDAIDLGAGVNVTLQGSRPLELVSFSYFNLATTLNATGGNGTGFLPAGQGGGVGILGGYDGGHVKQDGLGPGHGYKPFAAGSCCGGGSGAGFGGIGGLGNEPASDVPPGATYGLASLPVLQGGSGGGGGGDCCAPNPTGSGGGAGGGAIGLVAFGDLTLAPTAQVLVNGGNGTATRSGGGGSGGAVRLIGDNLTIQAGALISATGGSTPFQGPLPNPNNRGGGGGGGGRVAAFSQSSFINNGTIALNGGTGTQNGGAGTFYQGVNDGFTTTLDLGTGNFLLRIDTDTGLATYTGDRVGISQGTVSGGIARFHFDHVDLGPGVTVELVGSNPLSIRADGDINIATVLDASGGNGLARTGAVGGLGGTAPGGLGRLGGGDGGRGGLGNTANPGLQGEGLGGGGGQTSCCGGGAGGGFGGLGGLPNTDTAFAQPAGQVYGDALISILQGGSGGGGGAGTNTCCPDGGGGGAGGGAIELISDGGWIRLASTGEILVDGGDGGGSRAGGGGSGGAIRLMAEHGGISIDAGGLLSAEGGVSHLTSSRGGGGGGGGRILLWANALVLDGVAQDLGFQQSNQFLSVLGGPGSLDPAGGTAGLAGTILFTVPEPSTAGLLTVGAVAFAGCALVRRRGGHTRRRVRG